MILSSLLILGLIGILLLSMLLPFQVLRTSADSSDSDTNTDQKSGQGNTGSGDTLNKNIATNDVEIEESATLSVCKVSFSPDLPPEDFLFTVTGNNPSPAQFFGGPNCVDVTIGPGEYEVTEFNTGPRGNNHGNRVEGDCVQDPVDLFSKRAIGEIQAGETQQCVFNNFFD
jgi:hypothetical protein